MITANALAELAELATGAPWVVTPSGAVAGGRGVPCMVIVDGSMDNDDRALILALANNRDLLVAALALAEADAKYEHLINDVPCECKYPGDDAPCHVCCDTARAQDEYETALSAFRSAKGAK